MVMETLPYAQTRDYVEKVMANYWIYRRLMGQDTKTLDAIANGERSAQASLDRPVVQYVPQAQASAQMPPPPTAISAPLPITAGKP
jgi:hypothetical protein